MTAVVLWQLSFFLSLSYPDNVQPRFYYATQELMRSNGLIRAWRKTIIFVPSAFFLLLSKCNGSLTDELDQNSHNLEKFLILL